MKKIRIINSVFIEKYFSSHIIKMFKGDLSGMTEQDYKEIKQYLKNVYDIDSVFLKPLDLSPEILIYSS